MMTKTVFTNIGELLTLSGAAAKEARNTKPEDLSIISSAAMVTEGRRILWVGTQRELPQKYKSGVIKKISLKGRTVLPAFIECHTHALFAGHRSDEFELRNQGASYQQIAEQGGGILSTVRKTRAASLPSLVKIGQRAVDRFLSQGVTTVEIKSGYALNENDEFKMLQAAKKLKQVRVVPTFLGAHATPPEFTSTREYVLYLANNLLPLVKKKKMSERVDIFIEQKYFSLEDAQILFDKAKELKMHIVAHAEQMNRTGASDLAIDYGALSVDHVVELSSSDINKLAKSETTAVLLPGADYYLRMKYPPARQLLAAGARVALASDYNPGTCPTQDIAFIGNLARLYMQMSLPEVIVAYTLSAAFALGLSSQLGSLETGKLADFIVLEGGWTDLFYKVGESPIEQVWSEGKKIW